MYNTLTTRNRSKKQGNTYISDKIKVVEECLNGNDSICGLAWKYGISDTTICNWVRLYNIRGAEGLVPAAKTRKYSIEVKACAVEEYLSGEMSQRDIREKYDIRDKKVLRRWIMGCNSHGERTQDRAG